MKWSMIAACPSHMCSFNMGSTAGTKTDILCLMFVYVCLCRDWFCGLTRERHIYIYIYMVLRCAFAYN